MLVRNINVQKGLDKARLSGWRQIGLNPVVLLLESLSCVGQVLRTRGDSDELVGLLLIKLERVLQKGRFKLLFVYFARMNAHVQQ